MPSLHKKSADIKDKRQQNEKRKRMLPTQVIVVGFICVILVGTFLLCLPISSTEREFTDPINALFTATSATCVTGLTVETTAEHWSIFGQLVILVMIQIGGLGFMSMAVLFSLIVKRSFTPKEHLIIAESFGLANNEDAARGFMKKILVWTAFFEGCGALMLSTSFIKKYGILEGIYKSIFHSVSAFCNAGFDIIGENSFTEFTGDYTVLLTISFLIIIGGIGFAVWFDISSFGRKKRLSAYTRLVLVTSTILLLTGTVATAVSEWNDLFSGMSIPEKLCTSFAYSSSLRTAGFFFFDMPSMSEGLNLVSILLMLIGGASGSTAGGIKVSTFAVIIVAVISNALGKEDGVVFGRRIKKTTVIRAMSLFVIAVTFTLVGATVISLIDGVPMISAFFETVSAYATVGLSLSLTATLSPISKIILIVLMFMGRVGVLTVTFSLAMSSSKREKFTKYADTNIMIG